MLSFKNVCALSILLAGQLQANDWVELQKLTAGDELGAAFFGLSTALSANGDVLAVGGSEDSNSYGATWVYRKQADGWHQEGSKLIGDNADGNTPYQGWSVAISADGNRLATGAPVDKNNTGAVWIFEHNTDPTKPIWTQIETKLTSKNITGTTSCQGYSIALSGDGKKLAVGGPCDDNYRGATWIYEYDGTKWQEGPKLISQDTEAQAEQGYTVALSGDGKILAIGAPSDNNKKGAVLIYRCTEKVCTQDHEKIVAHDAGDNAQQGFSLALSSDGKTLAVSGIGDDSSRGAVWIYTYDGTWKQQGEKMIGAEISAKDQFGYSIALSSIGNMLLIGGNHYYYNTGAVWKFIKTSDNQWTQDGRHILAKNAGIAHQGCSVALSADGNLAINAGPYHNKGQGAVWIFGKAEPSTSPAKDYYFSYWIPPIAAIVAGLLTFGLKYIIKKHCCNKNTSALPTHIKLNDPLVMLESRSGSFA